MSIPAKDFRAMRIEDLEKSIMTALDVFVRREDEASEEMRLSLAFYILDKADNLLFSILRRKGLAS
jgi:hypothetical protein